ncbi:iron transporter [Escherichia coli]|uniref:iron transporter n=1 Tax=Escherichia coli TaxID=562 RepID=UPI0013EEE2B4|nr:iron transporter [Escherichia coli]KAF4296450.1 iron transporter [Escherichia coli]
MTMKKTLIASAVMASIFIAPAAFAFKEYPAGEPVTMNEMELAAVYLQPIDMEPRGMGLPEKQEGTFMPMVASDGPHYGANIKMMGVGNYKVTYHIEPPSKAGMHRHTDSETGVGRWWKPFDVSYEFKYVGLN